MKRILLLLSIAILIAGPVWGANCGASPATYYVRIDGNDANAGTSNTAEGAWRHHPSDAARTSACTLQSGDIVKFADDQIFYNTKIYATVAGTTIDRTGTGTNQPILSGAYDPTTLSWVNDSGTLYKTSGVTATPNIVVWRKEGVDTILTLGAAHDSLTANQWWWGNDGGTDYLFVEVGENPTDTIHAPTPSPGWPYSRVLTTTGDNTTIQNIRLELSVGVLAQNSGNSSVFNNLTLQYAPNSQYLLQNSGDSTTTGGNFRLTNSIFNGGNLTAVGFWDYRDAGIAGPIYGVISGNTFSDFNERAIQITGSGTDQNVGIAIYSNTISNSTYGIDIGYSTGLSVYSNAISNSNSQGASPYGISLSDVNLSNIYSNTISNICKNSAGTCTDYSASGAGEGIKLTLASNSNVIRGNAINGCYIGIYHSPTTNTVGNQIIYNVVSNSIVNSIDTQIQTAGSPYEFVYNNTVYHNPTENVGHGIDCQGNCKNIKIGNNIIYVANAGSTVDGIAITGTYENVYLDYNLIYGATGAKIGQLNGVWYDSLTNWRNAVQGDAKIFNLSGVANAAEANSISSNPFFTTGAYTLAASSPAINAGIDVSLTTDYDGKPIAGKPDIGAYERRGRFLQ